MQPEAASMTQRTMADCAGKKKVELVSTFMQADLPAQQIRINMPLGDHAIVPKPKNGSYAVFNPGCAGKSGNGNPP